MQSSSLWPVLWLKFSGVVGPVLPSLSLRDDNRSSSVSEWASVNPIDCGSVSKGLAIVDDIGSNKNPRYMSYVYVHTHTLHISSYYIIIINT